MTKIEAIAAMKGGKKVNHDYFTADEYMMLTQDGRYEFEDGCIVSPELFWHDRKNLYWENGWSIFYNSQPKKVSSNMFDEKGWQV